MIEENIASSSKLAIIYGSDSPRDGIIEYIGNREDDTRHIFPIVDYLHTHYLDDKLLQKVTIMTQPDIAIYLLVLKGNIVFINSSNSKLKLGVTCKKQGFFMMPNVISSKQKLSLINFKKEIADFTYLQIDKDITIKDGLLNSTSLISNKGETSTIIIDKYITDLDKRLELK